MTYEEFADARLGALLRYAVMLTGDPHQAQDLVQETMVRVQLNWRRGSWARRVLLRGEADESVPAPTDHAQSAVDRDQVRSWLSRLPRRQRAALVLRYYEDLPDGEIAEILGCAVGTVRSSISRALATLRAELVEVC
ncbi:sigma-70 family RNA polymerase sigma factor [Micromonospora sp. WMMD718]|uniref:sigma-70 family RNA polymerase sigma factor n=1 Tax=unclassified Micromonospora TaxID=2617518 RepID=UPI00064C1C36|nr:MULTISPECIES: sigma-70 family RNA polymerase sigma factor [unclassified Micromonospora]MDG4755179.1 sigma-70 family RNA polymerase sigma factor [Micromonospora sp. WMMD718]